MRFIERVIKAGTVIAFVDALVASVVENSKYRDLGILFSTIAVCFALYNKGKQRVRYYSGYGYTSSFYRLNNRDGHYYHHSGGLGPNQLPPEEEARQASITMIVTHILNGGERIYDKVCEEHSNSMRPSL